MAFARALLGGLFVMAAAGCASLPPANLSPSGPQLRVVTYNINWAGSRPDAVVAYLRDVHADVVCLQETQPRWESLLTAQLSTAYPHRHFVTSGGAGGIAFLSRFPLQDVRTLPATAGWFPALYAVVETPIGRVQVLNVHLRPPLSESGSATPSALYRSPQIHRAEIDSLLTAVDEQKPLLIAGDFNEHETDGGAGRLQARGFRDALAQFDRRTRTWEWPVASGITLHRRYDHILHNAALECTGAEVGDVAASDHFPVLAVFTPARD